MQQSKHKVDGGEDSHGIEHVATIVEGGIDTIRMLARGLSPFDGQEQNLAVALTEMCGEVNRLLPGGCVADIEFDTELLSADESLHLYRIAQESISNALRHAAPSRLTVRLLDVDGRPQLEIEDDGVGLPEGAAAPTRNVPGAASPGLGLGLRSIRSRAELIGLTVHLVGNATGGTTVRIGPA